MSQRTAPRHGQRLSDTLPTAWRLHALATCAVLPPLLSAVSLARLASLAGRSPATPAAAPDDAVAADYIGRVLSGWPRPWAYTCLKRGIVLFHMLRRAGRPVELHIGVRKDADGALQAHAWLVQGGAPYLESDQSEHRAFTVIATFPEPAAAR